jgi:GT2 family glycosyltransferase
MKISICILTFNRCEQLKISLTSLCKLDITIEILVIDNCSSDNTQKMVQTLFPRVKYIQLRENIGTYARNYAIISALGDIIIMLDDDIVGISNTDIAITFSYFVNDPQLGVLNFKVLDHELLTICNWVHHCNPAICGDKEFESYEITEGAVAFRRSVFGYSGYYPEVFFISHEGPDLALRILNAGFSIRYTPKISVLHYHATQGRKNWLNYYYDTRNHILLALRNYPFAYGTYYLIRGLGSMLVYSIRDGFFSYWARAIVDGIRRAPWALRTRSPLRTETLKRIRQIDKDRPGIFYLIVNRVLKRGARL